MSSKLKFIVSPPFDSNIHADLVLRSSDHVHFHVLSAILALASPVFNDMTSLAKPLADRGQTPSGDTSEDGLPIVDMHESNAPILDALLRILYPVAPPTLDNLDTISGLIEAAKKYDMESVLVVAEDALRRAAAIQGGTNALQVYMVAYSHDLPRTACLAALEFLKCSSQQTFTPAMEHMPAGVLFRLFDYRRQVSERVDALFAPIPHWKLSEAHRGFIRDIECPLKRTMKPAEGCGDCENGHEVSAWWTCLRVEARREIQKAPLADAVMNVGVVTRAVCASRCCSACQMHVMKALPVLVDTIRHEMERLAAEVELCFPS